MSRIYENPQQAIFDALCDVRAAIRETNNLVKQLIELTKKSEAGREHTGNE